MKPFTAVIASLFAASGNAQLIYNVAAPTVVANPAPVVAAPVVAPVTSSQYHAQDEFGQFSFGTQDALSARQESRNAYGVTTGGYQYVDANGQIQTVNYIADPVNGFRVAASNLPVAPAAPKAVALEAPVFDLEAPVFDLEGPAPVEKTAEVKEAEAKFFEAFEEAKSRERRQAVFAPSPVFASNVYANAYAGAIATPAVSPIAAPVAVGAPLTYVNTAPAVVKVDAPEVKVETPAAVTLNAAPTVVAAAPAFAPAAVTYNAAPAVVATAPAAVTYNAAPAAVVAAAPAAQEATLTVTKLNPGHAVAYRVD
jgi:hypothetical protein